MAGGGAGGRWLGCCGGRGGCVVRRRWREQGWVVVCNVVNWFKCNDEGSVSYGTLLAANRDLVVLTSLRLSYQKRGGDYCLLC